MQLIYLFTRPLLSMLIIYCLLTGMCSQSSQLNRLLNIATGIPQLVIDLKLGGDLGRQILIYANEVKELALAFRNNPTNTNLQNLLNYLDGLINRNVFSFNENLRKVFALLRFLAGNIVPNLSTQMGANGGDIKVDLDKITLDENKLKELEKLYKSLKK